MNSILITNLTPDEFTDKIREVIRDEFSLLTPKKTTPRYLTRAEVCELLKISLPTLNSYTRKKLISGSRIGTRILYNEDSIREAVKEIPGIKFQRLGK